MPEAKRKLSDPCSTQYGASLALGVFLKETIKIFILLFYKLVILCDFEDQHVPNLSNIFYWIKTRYFSYN